MAMRNTDYAPTDQYRRAALLDQMVGGPGQRSANTGVTGYGAPNGVPMPPLQGVAEAGAALAPDVSKPAAAKKYKLEGFDASKLADPTHDTPKYLIGRTLERFDPRAGVTPEVLDALNKLGIGTFSGSGDKVQIANGDPRFEGISTLDLVHGFNDPNGTGGWQYGVKHGAAAPTAPAAAGGGSVGLSMVGSLLPTDPAFMKQVQDYLAGVINGSGTSAGLSRAHLLSLMGQQ